MSDDSNTNNPFEDQPISDQLTSSDQDSTENDINEAPETTNPFDDQPTTEVKHSENAAPFVDPAMEVIPEDANPTNPFDDPAMDFHNTDCSNPPKKTYMNPFEDPEAAIVKPPLDEKIRDRYDIADDDDSVRSMLEMMETMHDPKQKYLEKVRSLRSQVARGSFTKTWKTRWMPGGSKKGAASDDDESLESYDCIALSSLREMKRKGDSSKGNLHEDIESSTRSKSRSLSNSSDGDKSSDGTHTTKNTVSGSDTALTPLSSSRRGYFNNNPKRMTYIILLASFLALILFIGILVLSYSLHALRNEEDSELYTREFWKKDLPDTLAFWKKDNDHEIILGEAQPPH